MAVEVKSSLSTIETDPLRNFKFRVSILNPKYPGFVKMGFMSVDGLSITTEVIPYREGGMNTTTQKMPGQSDFSPLTLSTGVIVGRGHMWEWMKQLFSVIQGAGNGAPAENFRHSVDIKVLDHPTTKVTNVPVKAWFRVFNTWPTSISISNLDAGANAIVVQQMTLAHEGFDLVLARSKHEDIKKYHS